MRRRDDSVESKRPGAAGSGSELQALWLVPVLACCTAVVGIVLLLLLT